MSMAITTVENVRCYVDEQNTAYLNAEDVARGLGFTQIKNGVKYIRTRPLTRVFCVKWQTNLKSATRR